MTPSNEFHVAQFFFGLAVLCFGYAYMYRRTKVDRFREDIFTMRDELFDYMWRQHIKFSNPGYIMMRATLNGAIGSSNYLTLPVFFLVAYHVKRTAGRDVLGESFRSLESEHRAFFEGLRGRVWKRLLTFVFLEGLLLGRVLSILRRLKKTIDDGGVGPSIQSLADPVTDELAAFGKEYSRWTPFPDWRHAASR